MRKSAPVHIVVHNPKDPDDQIQLAKRVAQVHADVTARRIRELNIPEPQRQALYDAVIAAVKEQNREQSG